MKLDSLPAAVFSPAKMIYIGYILLAALERIQSSLSQFLWVSVVFLLVQVLHDDFLRIRLNIWAVPEELRDNEEVSF